MSLLEKLRRWMPILPFQIALGDAMQIGVDIVPRRPGIDDLELVRFWAFAAARILYEIWFTNTPQGFLALNLLTLILERDLAPSTDCMRRAQRTSLHNAATLPVPTEIVGGDYLGRDDDARTIRFEIGPTFHDTRPTPLVMVSSVVLLQNLLERVKSNPHSVQTLTQTGRNLITQFSLEEWAGEASKEKLPEAAFRQALRSVVL